MASPPFSVSITSPANTDVAATFPTLDRSDKDVFQSWILVNHNNQGRHFQLAMDQVGSASGLGGAPTPPASTASLWYDSTGVLLEQRAATATTVQVSVPIGGIIAWPAASAPAGYLLCQGQSLATAGLYANLFAVIGYVWGGSGANFNIPDLRGRTVYGVDAGASRLTANNTLAATAGVQSITIAQANLPAVNWTVTDPGHTHAGASGASFMSTGGFQSGNSGGQQYGNTFANTASNTTGITVASGGSGTALTPQPGLYGCMNWIIRAF